MDFDLVGYFIKPTDSIRDAMACIDNGLAKVALDLDDEGRLYDTVTDGDVRRFILSGNNLDSQVSELRELKKSSSYPLATTAHMNTSHGELAILMQNHKVKQVPLVDDDKKVVGLITMQDLLATEQMPMKAVVMAGGYGERLRPLTDNVPKPMLTIGDRPLLEHIVYQLRNAGVQTVNITTHYKGKVIEQHFGDGSRFGLNIQYIDEEEPMGTAGALSLVEESKEPLLVINGDILTQINFRAMLDFHTDNGADMTVAVRKMDIEIPYGVIGLSDIRVISIEEKPVSHYMINAGIYLLAPEVCRRIPKGLRYDMNNLIADLVDSNKIVTAFPVEEYWKDIGQPEEYYRARSDAEKMG